MKQINTDTIIKELKTQPLNRIADALEEILRLVKLDLEKTAKRFPEPETDELSKEWKHEN